MKVALLLALLLALVTFATAGVDFTGTITGDTVNFVKDMNVTIDEGDLRFHYRKTNLVTINALNQVFYKSTAVSAEFSGSGAEGEIDCVFGYATAPKVLSTFPPTVLLAYVSAAASVDVDDLTGTFGASGALLGSLYYSLEERTQSGNIIKTIKFEDLDFTIRKETSPENPEIQYVVFSGSAAGAHISIAFVISSVTGILSVGGAAMTPKSVEVVVEISYDDYSSSTTFLRLNVLTATVSAVAEVTGTSNFMVSGSGPTQLYLHFNNEGLIDGQTLPVTVTGVSQSKTASVDDFGIFGDMLTANAELKFDARKVAIDFPTNARSITYDPSMGFEAPKVYSAAGTLSVPAFLIFAASALVVCFL